MNKPASVRAPLAASLASDIHEIRRSAEVVNLAVPSMPFPTSTCESLSRMALDHAKAGEASLARRAAEDSALMIEALSEGRRESDRSAAAKAALLTGEAFLLIHEAHRAKDLFEIATAYFDRAHDSQRRAAEARIGLAKALMALRDPSARAILEDAGELFEELGDHSQARAIDLALRQAQAEYECESPRSFHASSFKMKVAKPV